MTQLGDYFRTVAQWRDVKAEQYPGDERNARAAAALRSLSEYADSPQGASAREALERHLFDYEGRLALDQRAQREVSRYGYDGPITEALHEQFIEDLVPLCWEDAYHERVTEYREDPTGSLDQFEIDAAADGVHMQSGYWRRRRGATQAERERWVQEARAADRDSGEGLELPTLGEDLDAEATDATGE
jgi:hypothetical protein